MQGLLQRQDYVNKRRMTDFDDVDDNQTAWRVFRDTTTTAYVQTYFNTPEVLAAFIDYTYHAIFSHIILNMNKKIIEYTKQSPKYHIKPICGRENAFLLFKGGTLMNILYSDHLKTFIDKYAGMNMQQVIASLGLPVDAQDEDKKDEDEDLQNINYSNISGLNVDLETGKTVDLPDTFGTFFGTLLKKKFAVSDTDYSLYINADTSERFDILHKFAIIELAGALEQMANKFESYFIAVKNQGHPPDLLANGEDSSEDIQYKHSDILIILKQFVSEYNPILAPVHVPQATIENCEACIQQIKDIPTTNLYHLYDQIQILDLLLYLENNGLRIFAENDLQNLRNLVENKILRYINKKWGNLLTEQYYTDDKNKLLLEKLASAFNVFRTDPDNKMMQPKYEKRFTPGKVPEISIQKYQLNPTPLKDANVADVYYKDTDFKITTRQSALVYTSANPIIHVDIGSSDPMRIHYITHNTIINKARFDSVLNFDLMRIKFNVIADDTMFETVPEKKTVYLPSEFIDVSIPRFEDSMRLQFFEDMIIKNQSVPPLICIPTIGKVSSPIVYGYDPEIIAHDLEHTLSGDARCEPWGDLKYQKRLIRLIVFIMVANNCAPPNEIPTRMDNTKIMINLFKSIYDYAKYKKPFPINNFANTLIAEKNVAKVLIQDIRTNLLSYMHDTYRSFAFLMHKDIPMTTWLLPFVLTFVCASTDQNGDNDDVNLIKYIEITSRVFKQVAHTNNLDDVRNKFISLCQTIYDYGAKLYCVYKLEQSGGVGAAPAALVGGYYKRQYKQHRHNYMSLKGGAHDYGSRIISHPFDVHPVKKFETATLTQTKNKQSLNTPHSAMDQQVKNDHDVTKQASVDYFQSMRHDKRQITLATSSGNIMIGKSDGTLDYSVFKSRVPVSTTSYDL